MYKTLDDGETIHLFLCYLCNIKLPLNVRAYKLRTCIGKLMKKTKSPVLRQLTLLNTDTMLINMVKKSIDVYYSKVGEPK